MCPGCGEKNDKYNCGSYLFCTKMKKALPYYNKESLSTLSIFEGVLLAWLLSHHFFAQ
jgi:hypothetical protein